jgi:radical SAM superfamily enzyme YgiQ (UPF0313 family)
MRSGWRAASSPPASGRISSRTSAPTPWSAIRNCSAPGRRRGSAVIGFEEISDDVLASWGKGSTVAVNDEAVSILRELGITIVGDFIVSPDYDEPRFDALERYVSARGIDLPILSVLTPIPGHPLYDAMSDRIVLRDLDYYTFTNAVVPTLLDEKRFYERYAGLIKAFHSKAKL